MTNIRTDISQNGQHHNHDYHLGPHIPEAELYDVALRITKDGNRLRFNSTTTVGGTTLHRKAGLH